MVRRLLNIFEINEYASMSGNDLFTAIVSKLLQACKVNQTYKLLAQLNPRSSLGIDSVEKLQLLLAGLYRRISQIESVEWTSRVDRDGEVFDFSSHPSYAATANNRCNKGFPVIFNGVTLVANVHPAHFTPEQCAILIHLLEHYYSNNSDISTTNLVEFMRKLQTIRMKSTRAIVQKLSSAAAGVKDEITLTRTEEDVISSCDTDALKAYAAKAYGALFNMLNDKLLLFDYLNVRDNSPKSKTKLFVIETIQNYLGYQLDDSTNSNIEYEIWNLWITSGGNVTTQSAMRVSGALHANLKAHILLRSLVLLDNNNNGNAVSQLERSMDTVRQLIMDGKYAPYHPFDRKVQRTDISDELKIQPKKLEILKAYYKDFGGYE